MGNVCCKRKNNLEQYLEDVYVKECKFKADKEEVKFIKTGIETLVQRIVDKVLEGYHRIDELTETVSKLDQDEIKLFQDSLEEVYFPIKTGTELEKLITAKYERKPIIKVGSSYEETKNGFPDEFDFIFLLFSCKHNQMSLLLYDMKNDAHSAIKTVTTDKNNSLALSCDSGKRKLYFEKYVEKHGPATKLNFIYSDGPGEKKVIHVDLVPASKIIVESNSLKWYVKTVNEYVKPKSFRKCVLTEGYCLNVNGNMSFTGIEVDFIRNVLSKKHVKVYRILKVLINGHDDGETLEEHKNTPDRGYSSYQIKTMMLYHHDECTDTDTTDVGPCVIQVLREMCKYEDVNSFPNLFRVYYGSPKFLLLDGIQSLISTLTDMQTSEKHYDNDRLRMKSVSGQYLDASGLNQQVLTCNNTSTEVSSECINEIGVESNSSIEETTESVEYCPTDIPVFFHLEDNIGGIW